MMHTPTAEATKTSSAWRLEVAVRGVHIDAPPARVWALLTDAAGFARWNSTVTNIDGEIALGQKLKLKVPVSDRVFTPKVTELEPIKRMVWSDGVAPMFKGERTFTLKPGPADTTEFTMVEVFRGLMLFMIKSSLPDFAPIFERYAADLKQEAERSN